MGSTGPEEYLRKEYVNNNDGIDQIVKNKDPREQVSTKYNQLNVMQKLRYSPNEFWYVDYGFHYSETSNYDRYDRLIRRSDDGNFKSAEWYYGPQKWMMNLITLNNLNSNLFYDDFAVRIAYQFIEESRNDRNYQESILRKRKEKVDAYSINIDLNKELNSATQFLYGLETVINDVNSNGIDEDIYTGIDQKGPSRYPDSRWLSLAAYLVYQKDISDDLFLQSGLRYNYFNLKSEYDNTFFPFPFTSSNISDASLTGSLGLVYSPLSTWSIGLNLSTGFRAPNVDDIGKVFDSEPGSVVVPNPDLKAEKAYNLELGMAKVFNEHLKIDITGYYTHLIDAMVRRDFTINGLDSISYSGELSKVQAIQNASHAYVWGIQAGFELKILKHFLLTSTLNYQKGEEELDNGEKSPLRHAAPLFGTAHLTYKYTNLRTDLYLNYNGTISNDELAKEEKSKTHIYAMDENGNPYSPKWFTLNFKVSYIFNNLISLTAGIENITNERYRTYSSGISSPGRNFIISTKINF